MAGGLSSSSSDHSFLQPSSSLEFSSSDDMMVVAQESHIGWPNGPHMSERLGKI